MFAVIIVAHEELGEVFLRCANHILGEQSLVSSVSVDPRLSCCKALCQTIEQHIKALPDQIDILILADLFGATPCNATMICQQHFNDRVKIIAGLNFPMLLKTLTIRHLPISDAIDMIISTGQAGIFDATEQVKKLLSDTCHDRDC